jgi:hypothetical protein
MAISSYFRSDFVAGNATAVTLIRFGTVGLSRVSVFDTAIVSDAAKTVCRADPGVPLAKVGNVAN